MAIARPAGAAVIVNDRVDVARLRPASACTSGRTTCRRTWPARLLGPAAMVGCSTHTPAQLDAALAAPVSYVAYRAGVRHDLEGHGA